MNRNLVSLSLVLLLSSGYVRPLLADQTINGSLLITSEDLNNKIVGTRIDDLAEVSPKAFYGLYNIKEIFAKNAAAVLGRTDIEMVHNVFFSSLPSIENGENKVELTVLVKYKSGEMNFEKVTFRYQTSSLNLANYTITKSIIANIVEVSLEASVSLVERKLIVEDKSKNIKMIFPIGVGAFDEGVLNEGRVSLLTPRFQNGFLDKRVVISKREKPKYFKGLPFIRILKGPDAEVDKTPIGFHIEINDSFVRGFDSHGCMRLREFDLLALHDLIMMGDETQLPIKVLYQLEDKSDSPIAKRNKTFRTILNIGNSESPFFILDRDNLVQTSTVTNRTAPMEKLLDDEKDNYEDVFSYDTDLQLKEQNIRRENECKAKVLAGTIKSDEKSFQKCIDAGKRKDSLSDRIYRKYMGIDSVFFRI
jgi:uncharacterized protein YifE (UPF0438 family)